MLVGRWAALELRGDTGQDNLPCVGLESNRYGSRMTQNSIGRKMGPKAPVFDLKEA